MDTFWPLSKVLLLEILEDHINDNFVSQLVWERLGYHKREDSESSFQSGPNTPDYWKDRFPFAPEIILKREASVHLTRSIPKAYKQALKDNLNFKGYSINELHPRRTRRATAVNWLLAWQLSSSGVLPNDGPLPALLPAPSNPLTGHDKDSEIY